MRRTGKIADELDARPSDLLRPLRLAAADEQYQLSFISRGEWRVEFFETYDEALERADEEIVGGSEVVISSVMVRSSKKDPTDDRW